MPPSIRPKELTARGLRPCSSTSVNSVQLCWTPSTPVCRADDRVDAGREQIAAAEADLIVTAEDLSEGEHHVGIGIAKYQQHGRSP
ncbi:MAG TPA: hypothetical protein VK034_29890 [Enhygromyxa sp.]|nr:hypothetical protein [Enhygromyxa sp.]